MKTVVLQHTPGVAGYTKDNETAYKGLEIEVNEKRLSYSTLIAFNF